MKETILTMNFEPHECIIFLQSTKIGTHENKAIHCIYIYILILRFPLEDFIAVIILYFKKFLCVL